ncbi:FAD-binding domain-containing protein [Rhizodiscina lignyota]|uniref:FAD-binding domain-containing protein n=1 Tax=Rhizodiscina lignyota TaxID=1504668 RepID=A0A9P4MAL2_9PEZI|nr:FAD-binding domain-containing protein [Rhizodiscina lignyota]
MFALPSSLTLLVACAALLNPPLTTAQDSQIPLQSVEEVTKALKESGSCCDAISSLLPGKVFSKGESEYQDYTQSFWMQNARELSPRCVVIPSDVAEVSTAISVLGAAHSEGMEDGCKFAIRSGPHATHAKASNIEDGVVVYLKKLNDITISEDQSFVSVGPGTLLGEVYGKLDPMDLTIISGRDSNLGMGGLTMGGGISFLSPRYGFSCDHVLNYEVVLSSGAVVSANATSNPDLYRALKGGNNNFGVVTRFDFTIIQQGKFWGGVIVSDIENRNAYFDFIEKSLDDKVFDPHAALVAQTAYIDGMGWSMMNILTWTKAEENPAYFKELLDLPNNFQNSTRISTMLDFNEELDKSNPHGKRVKVGTFTFKPDAQFMKDYQQMFNETVTSMMDIPGIVVVTAFQPQSKQVLIQSEAYGQGRNSLGFKKEDGDSLILFSLATWDAEEYEERVDKAIKDLNRRGEEEAARRGLLRDFIYMSYAGPWQDPIGGYGKENVEFMRKVSKEYDPSQLFQLKVPSGFKLSKAEGQGRAESASRAGGSDEL